MELQDFARNVSGASEALAVFEHRLRGQSSSNTSSTSVSGISGSGSASFASNLTLGKKSK